MGMREVTVRSVGSDIITRRICISYCNIGTTVYCLGTSKKKKLLTMQCTCPSEVRIYLLSGYNDQIDPLRSLSTCGKFRINCLLAVGDVCV